MSKLWPGCIKPWSGCIRPWSSYIKPWSRCQTLTRLFHMSNIRLWPNCIKLWSSCVRPCSSCLIYYRAISDLGRVIPYLGKAMSNLGRAMSDICQVVSNLGRVVLDPSWPICVNMMCGESLNVYNESNSLHMYCNWLYHMEVVLGTNNFHFSILSKWKSCGDTWLYIFPLFMYHSCLY